MHFAYYIFIILHNLLSTSDDELKAPGTNLLSGKNPRLFSDIRQSYIISFYPQYLSIPFVHAINVIAFVAFIACDNAGGAVLGNVVRPDDFKRRVLHNVHRR